MRAPWNKEPKSLEDLVNETGAKVEMVEATKVIESPKREYKTRIKKDDGRYLFIQVYRKGAIFGGRIYCWIPILDTIEIDSRNNSSNLEEVIKRRVAEKIDVYEADLTREQIKDSMKRSINGTIIRK